MLKIQQRFVIKSDGAPSQGMYFYDECESEGFKMLNVFNQCEVSHHFVKENAFQLKSEPTNPKSLMERKVGFLGRTLI